MEVGRRVNLPDLTEAPTGHFDAGDACKPGRFGRSKLVQAALAELDQVIAIARAVGSTEFDLLRTIPGVGEKVAQVILVVTSGDMSRFPSGGPGRLMGTRPSVARVGERRTPAAGSPGQGYDGLVGRSVRDARRHGRGQCCVDRGRVGGLRISASPDFATVHER